MTQMTDEQKLERVNAILDIIILKYFRSAEISLENAYALIIFSRAFVEKIRNISGSEKLCADYDMYPDQIPMLFPSDETIEKHIDSLAALQKMLSGSWVERDEVIIYVGNEGEISGSSRIKEPYLRLMPS